ncbi:MAG: hypothetical protein AMXMBFR83_06640 [Phycisphaerae bacterium]
MYPSGKGRVSAVSLANAPPDNRPGSSPVSPGSEGRITVWPARSLSRFAGMRAVAAYSGTRGSADIPRPGRVEGACPHAEPAQTPKTPITASRCHVATL